MAKAKKTPEAVAPEAAAELTSEQVADATAETPTEGIVFELGERNKEVADEKAKRERGYSQTAIDKADLECLNAFKNNIKETRKLSVSNQTIIAAALDCLAEGANMEAFLKKLVAGASDKQRAKDLKAFEALKAKLEQPENEA